MCSKMATFLFSAYFGIHFVTIAMVAVKLKPNIYIWTIVLINQKEENGEMQLLFLTSKEGQNSLLMHTTL